jgi:chemotaxis protein CheX
MEQDIPLFEKSLHRFFNESIPNSVQIGPPVLGGPGQSHVLDYTGLIAITGTHRGSVFFSTGGEFLDDFIRTFLGADPVEELRHDAVGEIANNIAAGCGEFFGKGYIISEPAVVRSGEATEISLKFPSHVFQITWQERKAFFVIGLERA